MRDPSFAWPGWTLFFLAAALVSIPACSAPRAADLVFVHGAIRTLRTPDEVVPALAVRGETIVFTGSNAGALEFVGPETRVIELDGHTVLPGFTDAHVHPVSGGLALLECDLAAFTEPEKIVAELARFARAHPERAWVRGENTPLAGFPGGNPRKEMLDAAILDRPVFVSSVDGHSAWVNSKALELAGITRATPDPGHGRIERDAAGEPSGTLREDAVQLVSRLIPPYTHADRVRALQSSLALANSLGITNLIDASAGEETIQTYLELARAGELTAHVNFSVACDLSRGLDGARDALALNARHRNDGMDLRFDQVKLFMDGVVEGKTAAMMEDYSDELASGAADVGARHAGDANTDPATARAVIALFDAERIQVHVHAIGDRAIRMTLDAFEHARKVNGTRDSRHHIAHLHVVHPDDLLRFKTLDVLANFQALWATLDDPYVTELNAPFLGPVRAEWQYPIGSIARAGGRLVFGSDWPVSTMNPFPALQVAVTRRGPDAVEREPWTPQHLIDVASVIDGYTRAGAFVTFRESEIGTLESGKLADLIVLDRDPLTARSFDLSSTRVELTLFRGRIVHEAAERPGIDPVGDTRAP